MDKRQLLLWDLLEEMGTAPAVPADWSLSQLIDHYLRFKCSEGLSPSFLASIRGHLRYFTDWLKTHRWNPDQQKLSDLSTLLLSDYRLWLADNSRICVTTANLYILHVRMLIKWAEEVHGLGAVRLGCIKLFPTNRKAKYRHGRKQHRNRLGWDELERLFCAADVVDTALLLMGLNCGFGNMDIGTLKQSEVNLEAGTVSHPRSKTGVNRHCVLWPETIAILRDYLKDHRGKPANQEVSELFFIGKRGNPFCWERIDSDGTFRRSDSIKNRFVRLYKKAKLQRPYGRGYYSLRHTHASLIALDSQDIREVQASLGQVTLTQQEVYRHDRKEKATIAQKRIHTRLTKTIIPAIISAKCIHEDHFDDSKTESLKYAPSLPIVTIQ